MGNTPPTPKQKRRRRNYRLSRDTLLFVAGLLGIAHETLVMSVERPSLLILFASMIGLTAYLRRNGL